MRRIAFFVILAAGMVAFQGCGFAKKCGTAILEGAGASSYDEAGFGVELKVGGDHLMGSPRPGYEQVYTLMEDGVSVTAYPAAPNRMPNAGTWKATKIQWNNGKTGAGFFITNCRRKAHTDVVRSYTCTITWGLYVHKVSGGKSIDRPTQEYTNSYFFQVKHVGLGK